MRTAVENQSKKACTVPHRPQMDPPVCITYTPTVPPTGLSALDSVVAHCYYPHCDRLLPLLLPVESPLLRTVKQLL